MVLCTVIECYKRSDRDKDVSFYRIPAVINHIGGERERELIERACCVIRHSQHINTCVATND